MPMNEPNALQRIYRDLRKSLDPHYIELQSSLIENTGKFSVGTAVDSSTVKALSRLTISPLGLIAETV